MGCSASKTDVEPTQPAVNARPAAAIATEKESSADLHPVHPLMGFAPLSDDVHLSDGRRNTNPGEQTSCSPMEGTSRAASHQFMSPDVLSPNVSHCLTPRASQQGLTPPMGSPAGAAPVTPNRRRRPQAIDVFPVAPPTDSGAYVPAAPAFAIDSIANFSSVQVDTPATSPLLRRPLTLENLDLHHRSESRRLIRSYNSNTVNNGGEPRTWEERMSQWVGSINPSQDETDPLQC